MSQWRLPRAACDGHSYFAHALALSAAHGPGPWPDDGYPLPDNEFAPAMRGSSRDGVITHQIGVTTDGPAAARAAGIIAEIISSPPDLVALQRLHDHLAELDAIKVADPLTDILVDVEPAPVREVGRWLAEHGTRRNAVATGIVLIGIAGDDRDQDLLLLLGSLEDLTLYAVVALARTQSDRDTAIFELARRVRAWGRIQAVERLEGTTDPRIKAWLLRDGFRNDITAGYLTYIAATTGDLVGALMESEVDEEVLDAAADILAALSHLDGPAKDMRHYRDGPMAIDRFLTLVRDRPSVRRVTAVLQLDEYLTDSRCRDLLTDLNWIGTVQRALESSDLAVFREALWPARELGLKVADKIKAWLDRHPDDHGLRVWHEYAERLSAPSAT